MNETLKELKSSAYDAIAQINNWQAKLNDLNNQIANFKPEEKTDEKPKETSQGGEDKS